jgi:quercetin dioxygenase-like cupin family protein
MKPTPATPPSWSEPLDDPCTWPDFVESWPAAKLEFDGLTGRILRGEQGCVIFMSAARDVYVPEHHHGAQWGLVLAGEMELSIGSELRTYRAGEAHYIPAGVDHTAVLRAGWKGIYVFSRPVEPHAG